MKIRNVISGLRSMSEKRIRIPCPLRQTPLFEVPVSDATDLHRAVVASKSAFSSWSKTSTSHRSRLMMELSKVVRSEFDALAYTVSTEHGKTIDDARGDIYRGLEVIDFATNACTVQLGETAGNISQGMDCHSYRRPLGVCAGIAPFNFPAMIPLWMFPMALVTGNTFILKPSERVPATAMQLYDCVEKAGFPDGVLNIVHGTEDVVNAICDHPDIEAVSFVGSDRVGKHVYRRASHSGKRVQCNMGAQNFAVVMPDAPEDAVASIVGAAFGSAGQRCMAISRLLLVDDGTPKAQMWIDELVAHSSALKTGSGDSGADVPPLHSESARDFVQSCIANAISQGATCLLDGRSHTVSEYPNGNFVAPTLLDHVTPEMDIYNEEVFGPVLQIQRVKSLDDAIHTINANEFGNGTAIFTQSGPYARHFQESVLVGQVGVNVPVPVPLPMFSFTGWRRSFWGSHNFYGKSSMHFYTRVQTVTTRWSSSAPVTTKTATSMPVFE